MNRYYKNFILCGDIDQYCLLCRETFHLILDIEKHVRSENHRKRAEELSCLSQFQKDLIYKIQKKYYCAICNHVMKKVAMVRKHIKSADHKLLKQSPNAIIKKPVGSYLGGYVTIDKLTFNKLEWNSIKGNLCHICNMDVTSINAHIKTEEHIIGLIQSTSNYTSKQYYRKLDYDHFHCFACKKIFYAASFIEHWVRCENNDDVNLRQLREAHDEAILSAAQETSSMHRIQIEEVRSLQGHYTIDDGETVVKCKYCPQKLPLRFRAMMKHIKELHLTLSDSSGDEGTEEETKNIKDRGRDSGLERLQLAKYGKKLNIKLNHNGSRGYCKLCDVYVPPHKLHFKIHCRGYTHRGYLEIIGMKRLTLREISLVYNSLSYKAFINSVQLSSSDPTFWINKNFFIDVDAFFFIYIVRVDQHYKKIKCLACIEIINTGQVFDHCMSMKHRTLFDNSKIVSKNGEFIREIVPHFYHCGFCNFTLPYSKSLEDHLRTKEHALARDTKTLITKVPNFVKNFNPNILELSISDEDKYIHMLKMASNIGKYL